MQAGSGTLTPAGLRGKMRGLALLFLASVSRVQKGMKSRNLSYLFESFPGWLCIQCFYPLMEWKWWFL